MIDKKHVESLLKINGIEKTAPDEEIRSVLLSARFKDDEVETALMVLRENVDTKQTKVDGLHKVFRTDQALKPSEISQLLGIDVNLSEKVVVNSTTKEYSLFQFVLLWLTSIILAVTCILFYMYSHKIGVFHPQMNLVYHEQT